MKTREKTTTRSFYYNMFDFENCNINPFPLDVEANDLGHALQKIAAVLADDCMEVQVWLKKSEK